MRDVIEGKYIIDVIIVSYEAVMLGVCEVSAPKGTLLFGYSLCGHVQN